MTGFGKSVSQYIDKKISIEIKSLNSKNLDINARIPQQYREKEIEMRKLIAKYLLRGKVDFTLYIEMDTEAQGSQINTAVVKNYMDQLREIQNPDTELELLKIAMRLPDTLKTMRDEIEEEEYLSIQTELIKALTDLDAYRLQEGEATETDLALRIQNIKTLLEQVTAADFERVALLRVKLEKSVTALQIDIDQNRFEQELLYYLEKLDINEEKVRLSNHLRYFLENLASPTSNGKKLGFIAQEMGREINTIGSKSNFAAMQQLVVQMKDELEKIKEQLLNVL